MPAAKWQAQNGLTALLAAQFALRHHFTLHPFIFHVKNRQHSRQISFCSKRLLALSFWIFKNRASIGRDI